MTIRAQVFTLSFSTALEGFDDEPLRRFLQDKTLLEIRDHFFTHDQRPYLVLVVLYRGGTATASKANTEKNRENRDDSWRELLQEANYPVFDSLREWRAEQAKKEGVPLYIICTNRQLAEIAQQAPQSLSALNSIKGFGKAKLEKYGQSIMTILGNAKPNQSQPTSEQQTVKQKNPNHAKK